MTSDKEKLLAVTGSLLALGTGVAATIGQKVLEAGFSGTNREMLFYSGAAIGGGIAVNLMSNTVQHLWNSFSQKVVVKHPDELNHDLRKILVQSVKKSLQNLLILYKDEHPPRQQYLVVKEHIKLMEDELGYLFSENPNLTGYDINVKAYIHSPMEEAKLKMLATLRQELAATDLPEAFIQLFNESFVDQFRLCFTQELKGNGDAWVAFQKMMMEGLKEDLEGIIKGQQRIESGITDLKKQQTNQKLVRLSPQKAMAMEKLLAEINQPARLQLQLNKALDDLLGEIKKELTELRRISEKTLKELVRLKTDWWSRKMVMAYTLIIALLVTLVTVRNYYLGQPFMINVIVHGPKGTGDIILKNRGAVVINYGDKTEKQVLDESGEALFRQIPGKYRGDSVLITVTNLEGDPYKPACNGCKYKLAPGQTFYVPLNSYGLEMLNGVVVDDHARPVPGASIIVQDIRTETDDNGFFRLKIPLEKQQRFQNITIVKKGYREETVNQVPPHVQSRPLEIQLHKN
jgi:hypothetical protein